VRLYLDLNCFNRPFNDQTQERIARETGAVFQILQRIIDGADEMVWSAVLEFENSQHPLADRRAEIARWAHYAIVIVGISEHVAARAHELDIAGLDPLGGNIKGCVNPRGDPSAGT
jgi:hypothetical protein